MAEARPPAPPAPREAEAIHVEGLSRVYGARRALDGLDLTVNHGEFLTLFGPNGAGKTTFIKILARLARPSSGLVRLFGKDLLGDDGERARERIGLVGHASFLYAGLSARENLEFYARMHDVADPTGRTTELLEQMGLLEREGDRVASFSRGMQQRLSIARALVHDPDLVLLDEPYTGLDPHAADLLSRRLQSIHAQGRTVLMTSHDLALGRRLSTRFVVLFRGRVALDARPEDVAEEELARQYRQRVEAAR
ncbi:MAG: heme ABC exporter ATP-binding protein CcmA [Acidobacteriota bacterium]|jgi:heme exporter protein A